MSSRFQYIPIAPEDGLRFEAWGRTDDHRFASVFRDTWNQLPLNDREQMMSYWKKPPRICVWYEHLPLPEGEVFHPIAACLDGGSEVLFRSNWVDAMPDPILSTVIAHELGHLFQYAKHGLESCRGTPWWDRETGVENVMLEWEFCNDTLEDWIDDARCDFTCDRCDSQIVAPAGSWEWCRNCWQVYAVTTSKQVSQTSAEIIHRCRC